jgi:NitT/TauT family transport system ATP-binding protein
MQEVVAAMPASPAAPVSVLIEARAVAKSYPQPGDRSRAVLQPLDFSIAAGEFVSIVGPSGCGKSTLLKMVAGLLPPSAGQLSLSGTPINGPQQDVGVVFQSPLLLPSRTVLGNILLQAEMRNMPRVKARSRAAELIEMAGLSGFESSYPWQLSGGMQQRVAICRALLHDPAVLLMDEPFGALDAMTREQMNLELQRIWSASRKTVLLITHSIAEAVFLSDRVLVMSERPGSIAATYPIELPRPRTLSMMGSNNFAAHAKAIRGHFFAQGAID